MIRDKIFDQSPYQGFDVGEYKFNARQENHPVFSQLIEQIKPTTIIEVGTWKGASALHMAEICKKSSIPNLEIICVDTWLGSDEMWSDRNPRSYWGFKELKLKNGYPTIYYQFLSNVILAGHADVITPFPISSNSAALFLKNIEVKADLIYIDGGHKYRDVKNDIESFWGLLRKGGVMLGDDYISDAPGVIRAADEFADLLATPLHVIGGKWVLQKI